MELKNILDYQKEDMKLYKLELEFGRSEEIKKILGYKKLFDEKKASLLQLNKELDGAYAQIGAMIGKLDEAAADCDERKFDMDKIEDEQKLAELENEFIKIEEQINALSREIGKINKKINDISIDNKRINEEMRALNSESKVVNATLEKKKAEMLTKAKPIVANLKNLSRDIDEGAFAKYKELRKAKKMPAFVAYQNGSCCGCGMDISIEVGKKMTKVGDATECPHCGRIVYKMQ